MTPAWGEAHLTKPERAQLVLFAENYPPEVMFNLEASNNGTLLQCSCLENPRDGGAWWAAVSGVAQSRTRLK